MEPFLFEETYISPVWGGTRLAELRGLAHDTTHNLAEAFDVSAHPGIESTVGNGPYKGMPLSQVISEHRAEVLGNVPASDDAVLQVVWMDAIESLSVQVHPGEEYAQLAEGDHGKVEAWYVLDARPDATIIAGCSTEDPEEVRAATQDDSVGERCCERVSVAPGDFVLIPTGTLHALGAGILAVEVGSFGNTTYRLCDWGRGRELHVQKSLDVLDVHSKPVVTHLGAYDASAPAQERLGTDSGFYRSYVADVAGEARFSCEGRYAIITCVAGEAQVETPGGSVTLGLTRSCLVPACAGAYTVRGTCRVLRSVRA